MTPTSRPPGSAAPMGARPAPGADDTTDAVRFREAARAGDASAFALITEPYRRELHVHCYRMVGSYEDAQDLTQEVLLRAWRYRETFEGRASLRTWLYRVATNVCLDFLDRRPERRPVAPAQPGAPAEVTWLQPYPDQALERIADDGPDPSHDVVARETVELAVLVAIQHLPPRQRAVLVLRDIVGWSAAETADTLEDMTVAAVNSALQRARATMREHVPDRRMEWTANTADLSDSERDLLERYMDAHMRADIEALTALLHEDLQFAMPPELGTFVGRDVCVDAWVEGGFGSDEFGTWRCQPTSANGQPAVACYIRTPDDDRHRLFAIDVLTVTDGLVTAITAFPAGVCHDFGLPESLPAA